MNFPFHSCFFCLIFLCIPSPLGEYFVFSFIATSFFDFVIRNFFLSFFPFLLYSYILSSVFFSLGVPNANCFSVVFFFKQWSTHILNTPSTRSDGCVEHKFRLKASTNGNNFKNYFIGLNRPK